MQLRRQLFYFCTLLILLLLIALADPLDQALSQWFRAHSLTPFAKFMEQSLFEGKPFGAGDVGVILQITLLAVWLWRRSRLVGCILTSSILTALAVHLIKGVVNRPRPRELVEGLSSWHDITHRLLQGWGHGSFPSGHTANAISLIAVAYALHVLGWRRSAWVFAALVAFFTLAMGTSRVMLGAHWPTDVLMAAVLGWWIAHERFRALRKRTEYAA